MSTQILASDMTWINRASFELEYNQRVSNIDDFFNEAACIIQSRLMTNITARKCVKVSVGFIATYIQNDHQESQYEDYLVHNTIPTWLYSANDVNEFYNTNIAGDIKRKMDEFQQSYPTICLNKIMSFTVMVNDFDDDLE